MKASCQDFFPFFSASSWFPSRCSLITEMRLTTCRRRTSYKATVTKYEYTNPHTQVYFDVTDDKGNLEHWVAETTNPGMLNRVGWTRDTLKAGDQVTLIANPNKVGARVVFLQKVVFTDGKELTTAKAF